MGAGTETYAVFAQHVLTHVGPAPAQPGQLEIARAQSSAVPNKKYRGPQQVALSKGAAKRGFFDVRAWTNAVPESMYRGPQQELPGSPTRISVRWPAAFPSTPRKQAENAPVRPLESPTGVPNKSYRGPQQALPGSPTKSTGVPNKWHFLKVLQNGGFYVVIPGAFVLVFIL